MHHGHHDDHDQPRSPCHHPDRLLPALRPRRLQKLYFAYTTCPSCAKAYGHNYVLLFAQLDGGAN